MFRINKNSIVSSARLGSLNTAHGKIKTPFFMPVATRGALKHVTTEEVEKLGAQILLSNTYHLMLRPGERLVKKAGGLHEFMKWDKPILTDSGGFQVFSLAGTKKRSGENLVKLTKNGVRFKSYIDGKEYYLTPEKSLKIQRSLGVDIAVCLDVCSKLPANRREIEEAMELTTKWARKSKKYFSRLTSGPTAGKRSDRLGPLLFGVVQGGLDKDLRLKSLKDLVEIGFDGYNIGGLAVGESSEERLKVLDYLVPEMPANKPRYLMGVGYPEDIVEAVKRGVDMFDCVIPTREGRHGRLFQWKPNYKLQITNYKQNPNSKFKFSKHLYKTININNSGFANNLTPINDNSKLTSLREYSLAYLHYLFKIKEPLGQRLATLNNLEFYLDLMKEIRYGIRNKLL